MLACPCITLSASCQPMASTAQSTLSHGAGISPCPTPPATLSLVTLILFERRKRRFTAGQRAYLVAFRLQSGLSVFAIPKFNLLPASPDLVETGKSSMYFSRISARLYPAHICGHLAMVTSTGRPGPSKEVRLPRKQDQPGNLDHLEIPELPSVA